MNPVPSFKRILFMNPPTGLYRRDDRCQCKVEEQTVDVVFPPIDLAYLAAVAERAGAECRIRDYPAERLGWQDYIRDLREFRPDAILLNTTTATIAGDMQACQVARECVPGVTTIVRGEYTNINGPRLLREHLGLDLILMGESEETLEEILAGRPWHQVAGIMFHRRRLAPDSAEAPSAEGDIHEAGSGNDSHGGDVVQTPRRPFIQDLDRLPFPARHLLNNALYRSPDTGRPLTVIHGNRGCPAKCIYCPAGVLSDFKVRARRPEKIVEEIAECVQRHGIREFLFHGDTFTINKRWMIALCQGIVEAGLKIRWGCNSRVDTIDDERAQWMRRAGCWVVAFGFESGDQDMLDRMKKGARLEKAGLAVQICRRHGLRVHGFFLIGLPWETPETLEKTYRLAKELDCDYFDFNIAYPLPGTELYDIARRDGLLTSDDDLINSGYEAAAMRLPNFAPEDLTRWRRQALLKMYARPRYVARTIWNNRNPRVLVNYLRAARRRLTRLLSAR
ncbi:MAG: radical SAM protein [Candidatus Sumerlaeia bacterium]